MAAAAGILSQMKAQAQASTVLHPMSTSASSTGGTNSASDDSATISANDFLTLLVTEMQNQDPTADTDPNEYINQLVQVNSLEQLIGINQTLTTAFGSTTDAAANTATQAPSATLGSQQSSPANQESTPAVAAPAVNATSATSSGSALQSFAARLAPGNLSIPASSHAAQRVAHALDGQTGNQPTATSY